MRKAVIADSQFLSRAGMRELMQRTRLFTEVREVESSEDLKQSLKLLPAVIVVDPSGEQLEGALDLITQKSPDSKIVVICNGNKSEDVFRNLEYDIQCYLTKSCSAEEIELAFRTVVNGEKFFCNQILEVILSDRISTDNCEASVLSERELDVVKLIAQGLTTIGIAQELHLSPHTVYTHRKNIMRKAGVNSAPELVLYAVSEGLIAAR